ncbi:hypothetical protein B0H11DRAFT_723516 [Mycena galericulata]|nr:hypothetical protein B0H11DRAFT_723516 [Mycena galericulata]
MHTLGIFFSFLIPSTIAPLAGSLLIAGASRENEVNMTTITDRVIRMHYINLYSETARPGWRRRAQSKACDRIASVVNGARKLAEISVGPELGTVAHLSGCTPEGKQDAKRDSTDHPRSRTRCG